MCSRSFALVTGLFAVAALVAGWPALAASSRVVCGQVCALGGGPLADAQVTLLRCDAGGRAIAIERVWAAGDGGFEFASAAQPGLQVEARVADFLPQRLPVGAGTHKLTLTPLATIEGRLLDADGRNVAGADLDATAIDGGSTAAVTRWDGSFRLRVPPGRQYVVSGAAKSGQRVQPCSGVSAGRSDCVLVLAR